MDIGNIKYGTRPGVMNSVKQQFVMQLVVSILVVVFSEFVNAETEIFLSTVVVTGTRIPKSLLRTSRYISVINKGEIEGSNVSSVPEFLVSKKGFSDSEIRYPVSMACSGFSLSPLNLISS